MFRTIVSAGLFLLALGCVSHGQPADKSLTFDAASLKPATLPAPDGSGRIAMAGPTGGPGSGDPGRIRYLYTSLRNLLATAYDVKGFQIQGPSWLDTGRFDVNATMPPETTREQFRVMLQNLLTERFKMTLHRETRQLPAYALVIARGGPKMRESQTVSPAQDNAAAAPSSPFPEQPRMGADGFPVLASQAGERAGLILMMMPGRARLVGRQQTMLDLANRLTTQLGRAVADATGLTAKYDFTLTFAPEGMNPPSGPAGGAGVMVRVPPPTPSGAGGGAAPESLPESDTPPDIFRAIKEQLGLMLDARKGPVELIVIDHVEKMPIEN
jgi:uncharacterized protein (TIGR03435 family)